MVGLPMISESASFCSRLQNLVQGEPWQRRQWQHYLTLGFPDKSGEFWRHTPLSDFQSLPLQMATPQSDDTISYESLSMSFDAYRLVFVDGCLLVRCSDWIPKVCVTPLSKLDELASYRLTDSVRPDAFTYLMDATATTGVVLDIEPNATVNKPIYLLHISSGQRGALCSYRHHVEVGEHSECHIIEHHISLTQGGGVTFSRLSQQVGVGSVMKHTKIIEESNEQYHFAHNDFRLSSSANVQSNTFFLSGAFCRHQSSSLLQGPHAYVETNSLSLPTVQSRLESNTFTRHQAPYCMSRQIHKTFAQGKSSSLFNGLILVGATAEKTDGQMHYHGLIADELAQIYSRPQLEIYADDVKCSHGATTGQLDLQQIAYMRARGIPKQKAQQMLTTAFAAQVVEKASHSDVLSYLQNRIDKILTVGR